MSRYVNALAKFKLFFFSYNGYRGELDRILHFNQHTRRAQSAYVFCVTDGTFAKNVLSFLIKLAVSIHRDTIQHMNTLQSVCNDLRLFSFLHLGSL